MWGGSENGARMSLYKLFGGSVNKSENQMTGFLFRL